MMLSPKCCVSVSNKKIVYRHHVWMCPCGWNSVLKPMARSLVSDCYRETVERRPIPSPATMSNEEQAVFNRYTNTHSLSAHLLHCAWPCAMSKLRYRPIKKGREHVWTPHAAVLGDEGQSNLLSQLPELSVVTVTSRTHSADLLVCRSVQITCTTLNTD